MAYTAPTVRATGDLITASIWNADLVNDILYLKTQADSLPPILRGVADSGGTSFSSGGTGLSITHGGTGRYNLTWTAYSSVPVIQALPYNNDYYASALNAGAAGVTIQIAKDDGTKTDQPFSLLVMAAA